MSKLVRIAVVAALGLFSFAQAQNDSGKGGKVILPDGLTLKPHGYAHFEAGEIENGTLNSAAAGNIGTSSSDFKIDHIWTDDADVELGFLATYKEHLTMDFSLGAKLYFSYPLISGQKYTKYLRQDIYLDQLYAQYHFGEADMPWLLAKVGYFKFKYNPEGVNFGDYLFRTGTYPIYFDMTFDAPWQRLLGINVESNLFKSLKLDLLFTSATSFPSMNWSLSALASYDIAALHFVNIGAGVDFAHLIDVYTDHTFTGLGGDPTSFHDISSNKLYVQNGDTSWYTFKGTKIMARISIDPKAFIKWKYFGKNDLKLYGEADLIGVENYPDSGMAIQGGPLELVAPSYNNRFEKTPIMVGFGIPTFKALDNLNFELEYFGAKYLNDATMVMNKGNSPMPNDVDWMNGTSPHPTKSPWKWSVYAKRSFFNEHFAITGQIGRDHMRLQCASYNDEIWNELLVENGDWWWALKTSWMF